MKILEAIATLATIISLYFLSEGMHHGFTIGLLSNLLWMFWAHEKNAFGILITNALLLIINLNGLGVI